MKNTYLHYTKHRNPSLKSKTAFVSAKPCSIYRQREVPEDETRPRVEHQRVAPPDCHENVAIAAFLWQYQGLSSLVLVRRCTVLRGPSRYAPIRVYSSGSSSDVRKGLGSMYLLEISLLDLQEIRI